MLDAGGAGNGGRSPAGRDWFDDGGRARQAGGRDGPLHRGPAGGSRRGDGVAVIAGGEGVRGDVFRCA